MYSSNYIGVMIRVSYNLHLNDNSQCDKPKPRQFMIMLNCLHNHNTIIDSAVGGSRISNK